MTSDEFAVILGSDPHAPLLVELRAQMRAASEAEERAARHRWERTMLGSCPCGLAPGAAHCPMCDGVMGGLGETMREKGKALDEIAQVERAIVAMATAHGENAREAAAQLLALIRLAETEAERIKREQRRREDLGKLLAGITKETVQAMAPHGPRPSNRHERRRARSRRWRG